MSHDRPEKITLAEMRAAKSPAMTRANDINWSR
jgi:hypothetical protein